MVKKLVLISCIVIPIFAADAYEKNCIKCHEELPMSLQRMFMNYLLVYSGEKNTKAALKHYLRYPMRDTSVMSDLFLKNFKVKKPTHISDEELNEAIDIYWEKYKVIGKLQ